jgi:hypothetical protein
LVHAGPSAGFFIDWCIRPVAGPPTSRVGPLRGVMVCMPALSLDPVLTWVLTNMSERHKQANKVSVRCLPRNSNSEPRYIEIDNSEGELPIHNCVVYLRPHGASDFKRVGWEREVPNRQKKVIEVGTNGSERPRRLPDAQVVFRQDGRWWRKDSLGSGVRRTGEPDHPGPL